MFEHAVRDELNRTAPRRMAVLRPLKLVIENYPEGQTEELDAVNHPDDAGAGTREIPFGRELYIERDDFMEDPPKNFYRLSPGREVRLRYAYFVTCREAVKNAAGEIVELRCTYDPATRGGNAPDGRKVRGTIHWVSARKSLPAEIRLYNPLFTRPDPGADGDLMADLNPNSLEVLTGSPARARARRRQARTRRCSSSASAISAATRCGLVFNRTIGLRDSWAGAGFKPRSDRVRSATAFCAKGSKRARQRLSTLEFLVRHLATRVNSALSNGFAALNPSYEAQAPALPEPPAVRRTGRAPVARRASGQFAAGIAVAHQHQRQPGGMGRGGVVFAVADHRRALGVAAELVDQAEQVAGIGLADRDSGRRRRPRRTARRGRARAAPSRVACCGLLVQTAVR